MGTLGLHLQLMNVTAASPLEKQIMLAADLLHTTCPEFFQFVFHLEHGWEACSPWCWELGGGGGVHSQGRI